MKGSRTTSAPDKVNLGVGVYFSDDGKIPVMRAVAEAERRRAAQPTPRGYLPIEGIPAYDAAVQQLLLGKDSGLLDTGPRHHCAGAWRDGRPSDRRRTVATGTAELDCRHQ